jgi:hypothetical protein
MTRQNAMQDIRIGRWRGKCLRRRRRNVKKRIRETGAARRRPGLYSVWRRSAFSATQLEVRVVVVVVFVLRARVMISSVRVNPRRPRGPRVLTGNVTLLGESRPSEDAA